MESISPLVLFCLFLVSFTHATEYFVTYKEGTYQVVNSPSNDTTLMATIDYNATYNLTGWDNLLLKAAWDGVGDATVYYYSIGFGEGYLTQTSIYNNYLNSAPSYNPQFTPEVAGWVTNHIAFMKKYASDNRIVSPIAEQLWYLLNMITGLYDGYQRRIVVDQIVGQDLPRGELDMFLLSFQAEVGDIFNAYQPQLDEEEISMYRRFPKMDPRFFQPRHCSALVKILPDDVYFSHVTWSSFNSMLRQYKTYQFSNKLTVTMSGYPGVIHSIDDWYMTGSRLAVMETTNDVPNTNLFVKYLKNQPNVISEFLRVMIANFLATTSQEWATTFSFLNSGTYNNQWMVFDMKVFGPGVPLADGAFWVIETLPGMVEMKDLTSVLRSTGYWASYNIPYFKNIYNISGNLADYLATGNFFSYTNYSRAEIFRRNQSDVVDIESMKALMRYNDYLHDPFSLVGNCTGAGTNNTCDPPYSPMLAIASRGDLSQVGNQSKYGPNWMYLEQRNHCGIDVKLCTWAWMMLGADKLKALVINGPSTYNNLPIFNFSTSPWKDDVLVPRFGLPDEFNFPFISYQTTVGPAPPAPAAPPASPEESGNTGVIVGALVGGVAALVVIGAVVFLCIKSSDSKSKEEEALVQAGSV